MTPADTVADDEVIYRHVPGGPTWQAPPDNRISSINCRLRPNETGLSVSRAAIMSATEVMARLGNPATGSKIAAVAVAEVRAIGLEVVPAPLDGNPGHAEIRSATADLARKEVQRQLALSFAMSIRENPD